MEPIVIYLEDSKDEIKLTKKQFEKYIKDAYKQGYDNGYTEGNRKYFLPYYWTNTGSISTSSYPQDIKYTTNTPTPSPSIQVTCDAHNDL